MIVILGHRVLTTFLTVAQLGFVIGYLVYTWTISPTRSFNWIGLLELIWPFWLLVAIWLFSPHAPKNPLHKAFDAPKACMLYVIWAFCSLAINLLIVLLLESVVNFGDSTNTQLLSFFGYQNTNLYDSKTRLIAVLSCAIRVGLQSIGFVYVVFVLRRKVRRDRFDSNSEANSEASPEANAAHFSDSEHQRYRSSLRRLKLNPDNQPTMNSESSRTLGIRDCLVPLHRM
ncbi:uncharacterized protein BJ171DRAFT_608994 [Polychytrium aggregatum]|uniref:uncharacterized protein n=1 Tax=Polychytrium aggregatum TaxID=110093 RepID=UPI0022FF097F|nr:uncharacterized protein BJ171DRAFT_608994 [Polychytrium aggregatum]KAI9209726.1 hypothetical protein BJ171DRAFT_608994 [Polychytrium aggregatum]